MPSRSQYGRAMKESFDQHPAHSPLPSTSSRQAGQSVGNATSSVARQGARRAWMARAGHELLKDADAIIPVPLHWRRLWARRFNQSMLLS